MNGFILTYFHYQQPFFFNAVILKCVKIEHQILCKRWI